MGRWRRWRPSWRRLTALASVACITLALAGYDAPGTDTRYVRQRPDTSYCDRATAALRVLLDVLEERRSAQEVAVDLATLEAGFRADEARFLQRRRHLMARRAGTMQAVVSSMQRELGARIERGEDLSAYVRQLNYGVAISTDDYCRQPATSAWRGVGPLEARVPSPWAAEPVPWLAAGVGSDDPGIVLSPMPARWRGRYLPLATRVRFTAGDPLAPPPGAFLGASRTLARQLRLRGARTAVALDRLRAWMEGVRYDGDCRLVHVSPYKRPSSAHWGYVREWRDCQGTQTALVEAYVLNTAPGPDRPVVLLLQATATDPAELYAVPSLLDSFHVTWEQLP